MNSKTVRQTWFRLALVLVAPFAFHGLAHLILSLLGLAGEEHSKIAPNIAALFACVVLVKALALSAEDIGLKKITGRFRLKGIGIIRAPTFTPFSSCWLVWQSSA